MQFQYHQTSPIMFNSSSTNLIPATTINFLKFSKLGKIPNSRTLEVSYENFPHLLKFNSNLYSRQHKIGLEWKKLGWNWLTRWLCANRTVENCTEASRSFGAVLRWSGAVRSAEWRSAEGIRAQRCGSVKNERWWSAAVRWRVAVLRVRAARRGKLKEEELTDICNFDQSFSLSCPKIW